MRNCTSRLPISDAFFFAKAFSVHQAQSGSTGQIAVVFVGTHFLRPLTTVEQILSQVGLACGLIFLKKLYKARSRIQVSMGQMEGNKVVLSLSSMLFFYNFIFISYPSVANVL